MDNDKDWVEDVRRWYFNSSRSVASAAELKRRPTEIEATTLGYEAAQPSLQGPAWQTPRNSGFGALHD